MLCPLAEVFKITVDELLGYNETTIKENVELLIKEYKELKLNGHFDKAKNLITEARKQYPQDFTIMSFYMQHLASENLLENQEEILKILYKYKNDISNS